MKKSFKFLWRSGIRIVLVLTLTALVACRPSPADQPQPPDEQSGLVEMEYGDRISADSFGWREVTLPEGTEVLSLDDGILTARGVGTAEITVDGKTVSVTVSPAVVDVVLFTGQSNMVGVETSLYKVNIPVGQGYEYKMLPDDPAARLVEIKNPVGEAFGGSEASRGASIVPQFCADYVRLTGRKLVAVHVARGGRAINYFEAPSGEIYRDILQKYGACINDLESNPNFIVGRQFYVMYQGESDSGSGISVESYKTKFLSFHRALLNKFDFEFGALISTGRNTTPNRDGIVRIERAKEELATEHDDIILACAEPYNWYLQGDLSYFRADEFHLNGDGLRDVASEACQSILNFMGLGSGASLEGIEPLEYLDVEEP